jgi:hypothetical protein
MPRDVEQVLEDIISLWYAWPEAPRELFDELRDELEQAAAQNVPEQAPRPRKRSVRSNHGTTTPRS